MRTFLSWPIRVHLYLLVLLLVLPAIGVIIHSGIREREEAIITSTGEVEKLAHVIASEIQLLVGNTHQLSFTLSHFPDVQSRDAAALNPLLKELLHHYPYYTIISIADKEGVVWASSRPTPQRQSLAGRRYFRDAIATGQFSAGEYAIGKVSGLPTISFGYPLKDKRGAITGVIGISVNLRETEHLLARSKLPVDVSYSIFDHRGTFLFRGTDTDRFVGKQDRPELFKRMQAGPDQGIFDAPANDDVYRRVAYRKLRLANDQDPYMYIRAGIPVAAATKAANSALLKSLALFTPFMLLALALGGLISKRCIVDRVHDLQVAREQERERLVIELENERLRFESVLQQMPVGVMIAETAVGRETYSNKEAANIFRDVPPPGEAIDYKRWKLFHLDGSPLEWEHNPLNRALCSGDVMIGEEHLIERCDGTTGFVRCNAAPIRDIGGQIVGSVAAFFDITVHAKAAESLRASEQHMRRVLDSLTAFVGVMTPDGTLVEMNRAALDAAGIESGDVVGKHFEETHWWSWSAQVQEDLREAIAKAAAGETPRYDVLLRLRDGQLNPMDFSLAPLRNDGGAITHLIPSAIDIAARKQAETALQQAHDELEHRVGVRTVELASMVKTLKKQVAERKKAEHALYQETEQRLQALERLRETERSMIQQSRQAAMGDMINNIAHQWRQPLNTLGLHIQRLGLFHDRGEFSKELLDTSTREAMRLIKHMSGTIEDFSNFFKPDKVMTTFSVNETIRRTVALVEASFKQQQIALTLDADGDPQIHGYPNEYSQALLNILLNARDAFVEHHIEEAHVRLHSFRSNDATVVTIADNAGGISEEIMDKIFDPHFTTKGPQGSGIGLFMAKNIIERSMNGRLTVCNREKGAEFRIEI